MSTSTMQSTAEEDLEDWDDLANFALGLGAKYVVHDYGDYEDYGLEVPENLWPPLPPKGQDAKNYIEADFMETASAIPDASWDSVRAALKGAGWEYRGSLVWRKRVAGHTVPLEELGY